MATIKEIPQSLASIPFKDISVTHVPESSPTTTKVVTVAFHRPDNFNAITENLLTELEAVYDLISRDQQVRAVVLTGSGKAFCAGADLGIGFSGLMAHKKNEASIKKFRDQGGRVALAISRCHKPTIVAINGAAVGAGLTLTLPATIRVAWSGAKVGVPFSRRGLTLESCSAFYLPRLIGLSNAMHIATTGSTYSASDSLVSGLFSKLLPTPQDTVEYALKLATDIAINTSITSTKLMRDMMLYCPPTPEATHILDSRVFIGLVGSQDNVEGVNSFMEKRHPEFSGDIDPDVASFSPWWNIEDTNTNIVEKGKAKM